MRAKSLTLSFFSIFIVAMLAVFVSANITFNPTSLDETLTTGQTSITVNFDLVNDGVASTNYTNLVWSGTSTQGIWTILPFLTTSVINDTDSLSATLTGIPSTFEGTITGIINVNNSPSPTEDLPFTITVTALQTEPQEVITCNAIGNLGELRVKDIDFNNLGTLILKESSGNIYLEFGDDDEWFPLDEIEVEIEIENNGDFDIDDIEIEWGIYDTNSNKLIIEFDDEKDFNLKDGKDEIITVSFQLEDDLDIDLDELDDGKHYRFYVTATGIIDDSDSPNDGDETCASGFDSAEIVI